MARDIGCLVYQTSVYVYVAITAMGHQIDVRQTIQELKREACLLMLSISYQVGKPPDKTVFHKKWTGHVFESEPSTLGVNQRFVAVEHP